CHRREVWLEGYRFGRGAPRHMPAYRMRAKFRTAAEIGASGSRPGRGELTTLGRELPHRSVSPEPLELVELARRWVEYMNDEIHVVDQNPAPAPHSFHAVGPDTLILELL